MPRTSQLRPQILDTSLAILRVQGLEGLHARSIAARLSVNHASVHYYYKSRADLLAAVAAHAVALWEDALAKTNEAKDADALKEHLSNFAKLMDAGHPQVLIALLAAAPTHEGVAAVLREFAQKEGTNMAKIIEQTREADVRVRKGPLRQGPYLLGAVIGAELLRFLDPKASAFQDWPAGFSDSLID